MLYTKQTSSAQLVVKFNNAFEKYCIDYMNIKAYVECLIEIAVTHPLANPNILKESNPSTITLPCVLGPEFISFIEKHIYRYLSLLKSNNDLDFNIDCYVEYDNGNREPKFVIYIDFFRQPVKVQIEKNLKQEILKDYTENDITRFCEDMQEIIKLFPYDKKQWTSTLKGYFGAIFPITVKNLPMLEEPPTSTDTSNTLSDTYEEPSAKGYRIQYYPIEFTNNTKGYTVKLSMVM